MKLFGKVTNIKGNEITISLDNDSELKRILTLADGTQPLIEVNVQDARQIRSDQRKLAYSLFKDMGDYLGYPSDWIKGYMKNGFEEITEIEFSLSDTSVEIATLFLKYVIAFMFEHRIPFPQGYEPLPEMISWQMYCAIRTRCCAVCAKEHADIHHAINFVGMGNNRNHFNHMNSKFIALCRAHHNEIHNLGLTRFMELYHVAPIKLKEETLIRLKIMSRSQIEQLKREGA